MKRDRASAASAGMTAALAPSTAAIGLIGLYQRYLSPLKGFRCAHRARKHGRTSSCSQFAKRAFGRVGVLVGAALLRRRFDKCAASARVLREAPPAKRDSDIRATPSAACDGG